MKDRRERKGTAVRRERERERERERKREADLVSGSPRADDPNSTARRNNFLMARGLGAYSVRAISLVLRRDASLRRGEMYRVLKEGQLIGHDIETS